MDDAPIGGGIGGTGELSFPDLERLKKDLKQQWRPVNPDQVLVLLECIEQLLRAHYGR